MTTGSLMVPLRSSGRVSKNNRIPGFVDSHPVPDGGRVGMLRCMRFEGIERVSQSTLGHEFQSRSSHPRKEVDLRVPSSMLPTSNLQKHPPLSLRYQRAARSSSRATVGTLMSKEHNGRVNRPDLVHDTIEYRSYRIRREGIFNSRKNGC